MRALFVSLILFGVGLHCSFAAETVVQKESGEWLMAVSEDPFTKNRHALIGVKQKNKTSPIFVIYANQTVLDGEGKIIATPFLQFIGSYPSGDKIGSGKNMKISGILVDGSSMETEGETSAKDLIAAMLKGEKIIIRITEEMPKGIQVATISTPLEGFAECWNAIPKELIDLANPSVTLGDFLRDKGVLDKPLPATDNTTKNIKWLSKKVDADGLADWHQGVLVAYDATLRWGLIINSGATSAGKGLEGELTGFATDWFHELTQVYLKGVARKQKEGLPIKPEAPQLANLYTSYKIWTGKNGKRIQGVLMSYDSTSGVAKVKTAEKGYLSIKKDSLDYRSQTYLDVVAKYTPNGMPLRCNHYPRVRKRVKSGDGTFGNRLKTYDEEISWDWNSGFWVPAMNRTWTAKLGGKKFEGVLVGFYGNDEIVKVKRKSDGEAFTVKASTLSREDVQYLAHVYHHMTNGATYGATLKVVEP